MKSITVVIPVYNESGAIEENLPEILRNLADLDRVAIEFIVVDDGSTDGTAAWLKQFCESTDGAELLCLSRNFGKEAAILAGLLHRTWLRLREIVEVHRAGPHFVVAGRQSAERRRP